MPNVLLFSKSPILLAISLIADWLAEYHDSQQIACKFDAESEFAVAGPVFRPNSFQSESGRVQAILLWLPKPAHHSSHIFVPAFFRASNKEKT
jgi:hypothetical protein